MSFAISSSLVRVLALALCIASFGWTIAGFAEDNAPTSPVLEKPKNTAVKPLAGEVRDKEGKPIADALVLLRMKTAWNVDEETRTLETSTDVAGKYMFQVPMEWIPVDIKDRMGRKSIWAYKPGFQIGTGFQVQQPLEQESAQVPPIILQPAVESQILVKGLDDQPLAGAIVESRHFRGNILPARLRTMLRTKTDEKGLAEVPALPQGSSDNILISAAGYGRQTQRFNPDGEKPNVIHLSPVGRLEMQCKAEDMSLAKGVRVHVETVRHFAVGGKTPPGGDFDMVTDENGKFVISEIAIGELTVEIQFRKSETGIIPSVPPAMKVDLGQTEKWVVPFIRGVQVRGKVVDKDFGKGADNVPVSLRFGVYRQGATAWTNADGEYSSYVLPGEVRIALDQFASDFVAVDKKNEALTIESKGEIVELPTLNVYKTILVKGRLLDGSGKGIVGKSIGGICDGVRYGYSQTGADGNFVIRLPQNRVYSYETWTQGLTTLPETPPVKAEIVTENPLVLRMAK